MIYDALSNFRNYVKDHRLFPVVLDYLNGHDLSKLDIGKATVASGIYAVVSEYRTGTIDNKFIECHKKYVDIHIVISGVERIGVCNKNECKSIEEYNEEKDLEKLVGKVELLTVREGQFAVFYPNDAHVPGLSDGKNQCIVKKAVCKVPV